MQNFDSYFPVKFYFGKGRHKEVGRLLKEDHASKVLIHYGGGSIVKNGTLAEIEEMLDDEGIEHVSLGGQQPNPVLSIVRRGIKLALEEKCDYILSLGGGSVLDSAKAMVLGLEDPDIDVWDYFAQKKIPVPHPENHVGLGVVLTIAGAGSDGIPNSVLTNDEVDPPHKRDLWNEIMRPRFDILNPEFLYSVPDYYMANSTTDIVMHLLEGYFSAVAVKGNQVTDRVTEAYIKCTIKNGKVMMKDRTNYDACSEVMYAGTTAHTFICRVASIGDGSTHQMGHMLSGIYGKIHGETLTALWGSWARYVMPTDPERFIRLGLGVFDDMEDDGGADRLGLAVSTIEHFEHFFKEMGLPTSLGELFGRTLSEEEISVAAHMAATTKNPKEKYIGGIRKLYEPDITIIMNNANH